MGKYNHWPRLPNNDLNYEKAYDYNIYMTGTKMRWPQKTPLCFYIQSFQMTEYLNPRRALSVRMYVCVCVWLCVCVFVCVFVFVYLGGCV